MCMIGVYVVIYSALVTAPAIALLYVGERVGKQIFFAPLTVLWLTAAIASPIVALQG